MNDPQHWLTRAEALKPDEPETKAEVKNEKPKDKPKPKDEPKAEKPKPEKQAPKKSPHDWAVAKKLYTKAHPLVAQNQDHYHWSHACADELHGWSRHNYHYQDKPFALSEADYDAALKAAAEYPNTPPHDAAIPQGDK